MAVEEVDSAHLTKGTQKFGKKGELLYRTRSVLTVVVVRGGIRVEYYKVVVVYG